MLALPRIAWCPRCGLEGVGSMLQQSLPRLLGWLALFGVGIGHFGLILTLIGSGLVFLRLCFI
ncbi:hypothetical protein RchiOBHm_Chr6g0278071 [Rosa chinensis]|uniref:Uncharacterized protein n=1 Tax=Rosa chinensis TaxID=74649 RepID=A0A2P6PSN8_ROSCH|nr:hypothetical protein RchiOBHm_Chr6g0278071 [Rosa chinensis]